MGLLLTSEALLGILANTLVVTILHKHPKLLSTSSSKYLKQQAIIDTLACFFMICSFSNLYNFGLENYVKHLSHAERFYSEILCRIWVPGLLAWSIINASTYNLVVLTLERYLNIIHPFWSKRFITDRVERAMLVAPWVIGPLIEFSIIIHLTQVKNGTCDTKSGPVTGIIGLIYLMMTFLIPLIVLIYCYGRIWYRVKTRWINSEINVENTRKKCKS